MANFMRIGDPERTAFQNDMFPFNIFNIVNSTTIAHWHRHLEIVLIIEGSMFISINDEHINCEAGDLVIIAPGCLHSIECGSGKYMAMVIGDKLLNELMLDIDMAQILKSFMTEGNFECLFFNHSDQRAESLKRYTEEIMNEFRMKNVGFKMNIKLKLSQLMLTIHRMEEVSFDQLSDTSSIACIKLGLNYIDQHYKEKISLEDLCRSTNLSLQHFSRLFKAYTGKTFIEYLTIYRLDISNWYLLHTDLPITRIPEEIGVCNANYYARIYKKHYGVSPRDVRNKKI